MPTHIESFEKFAKDMGIDLNLWKLSHDKQTENYSEDNECRILFYVSTVSSEYTIYAVLEDFNPGDYWEIIEFSISGD